MTFRFLRVFEQSFLDHAAKWYKGIFLKVSHRVHRTAFPAIYFRL